MEAQTAFRSSTFTQYATRPNIVRLMNWDMTDVKKRLIHDAALDAKQVEELEREYKRFLLIIVLNPEIRFPISKQVDVMWHTHLLFTRDYAAMCREVNHDTFIHHQPMTSKVDAVEVRRLYFEHTLPEYERVFGSADDRFWPREGFIHCSFKCTG